MSDKRPWTPSRLLGNGMVIYHPDEYEAVRLLNEKAPDMAEILIKIYNLAVDSILFFSFSPELFGQIEELLSEFHLEYEGNIDTWLEGQNAEKD